MIMDKISEVREHVSEFSQKVFDPDKRVDVQDGSEKLRNAASDFFDPDRRVPLKEVEPFRELTSDEKQSFADRLDYPLEKMDKFKIDDNGVLHLDTINQKLENKRAENGVPYFRRMIEYRGVKIEGVFPKFHSAFDTKLDPDKLRSPAYAQFCNADLKEQISKNPLLRLKFNPDQIADIENGRTPDGYVWHHNEEPGRMQLVKQKEHEEARHTGGGSIWGYHIGVFNNDEEMKSEGERF